MGILAGTMLQILALSPLCWSKHYFSYRNFQYVSIKI